MHNILIIDDQEGIRTTYCKAFTKEGYCVFTAASAADGYKILKHQKIDLLLLDIKMPEVDGVMFNDVVRLFHNGVKVIVSSVYPLDEQRYLVRGAVDYFDKCEGIKALKDKVKRVLSGVQKNN